MIYLGVKAAKRLEISSPYFSSTRKLNIRELPPMDFGKLGNQLNQLTTKNLFTTKRIFDEIILKLTTKTGMKSSTQQYKYLYIISKIITQRSLQKDSYVGCKLNIKNLTILFGNKHSETSSLIKDLVSWSIIYKVKDAILGSDAARYSLTQSFAEDKILILSVDVNDASFIEKLIDYNKIESDKTVRQLGINIYKLSLNTKGISYLSNKYKLHPIDGGDNKEKGSVPSLSRKIEHKRSFFLLGGVEIEVVDLPLFQIYLKNFNTSRPDPKSRVFNNLTNLKRDFREYISFDGSPLFMTDISNSQVLISAAAVRKQYSIVSGKGLANLYDDVKHYQQLAETGQFYEYLIEKSGYQEDRNKFKKDFFSQVFFSKVVRYSMPIKDLFVKEFPNVYKLINQLKAKSYKDFAIKMQQMEASIMIDDVAKKMVKAGKCILTLHDAIVCSNQADLELAEQLITDSMSKLGLVPNFKREIQAKKSLPISNISTIKNKHYNSDLDTLTFIAGDKIYYLGNISIINSNLPTSLDINELQNKLIVSDSGKINYNGTLYKFYKYIEGDETMILLVA